MNETATLEKTFKLEERQDTVYYTSDYQNFSYIRGNRSIDQPHVKELLLKIKESKYVTPVLITKDGMVIDGQHRVEVCQILGIPVPFIIVLLTGTDWVTKIIGILNSGQSNWTMEDFLRNYEVQGIKDYLNFKELYLSTNYPISFLVSLCWGDVSEHSPESYREFRSGELDFPREKAAQIKDVCELIDELRFLWKGWTVFNGSARFLFAIVKCITHPRYSQVRMIRQLEKDPGYLRKANSTQGYLEEFEVLYNRGVSGKEIATFVEASNKQVRTNLEINKKE